MKKTTLKQLRDEAQEIYGEYGARFAGKPRATRDISALESIIERLEDVVKRARQLKNGGQNPALSSFLEQALENLETYERERENIADVQAQGPAVVEGSQLATWANLLFGQYFRHFAGQSRATRDLGLLNEIISELELIQSQMKRLEAETGVESVSADLGTVEENLGLYRDERDNILDARKDGTLEQQASYLALVANEQFGVYNFHFGGRPRISRRPGLLHRVIANLESIRDEMVALEEKGFESEQNRNNIDLINTQIETYREEFDQVQEAKRQTPADELVGSLGRAANEAMAQYSEHFAGEDRASRDLELLSRICDELLDVGRQMRELKSTIESQANERNLNIVLDNVLLYQDEYEQIREVQG